MLLWTLGYFEVSVVLASALPLRNGFPRFPVAISTHQTRGELRWLEGYTAKNPHPVSSLQTPVLEMIFSGLPLELWREGL